MNVLHEFPLKCGVTSFMWRNDSLQPDAARAQRNTAFCLRRGVNQKAPHTTVHGSAGPVWAVCGAHRRSGLGTLCPGASGLVSRLNWITAGASARRDEMASQDGYKVKTQPERKQRACPGVRGRSAPDGLWVAGKNFTLLQNERVKFKCALTLLEPW